MKFLFRVAIIGLTLTSLGFILCFNVDRNKNFTGPVNWNRLASSCNPVPPARPDVDLASIFPTLEFNATWISRKYFWLSNSFDFEGRHRTHFNQVFRGHDNLIKVIVLPHSHNDPGWRSTYEQYYHRQTRLILDNVVTYLTEFPDMTFVWSEITYLAKWWKDASPKVKEQFRKLVVEEQRLEIATGGWVVPDEAASSLYSLAQELTEGQQWVYNNLNVIPKYSWAIDPFGHSSTHSHLLSESNMRGMVIQRLHYVWKHWLAQHKTGEFKWRPRWDPSGVSDIPCLTLPYDLYSVKHACGPQPQVCLKFDFRSIPYEYGESFGLMTPITKANLRKSAQEIAAQYIKTASLTNHNVVLVPLGDDFRYDRPLEWVQQYTNYMQLFTYINSHQDKFRMEIRFGTLSQYFEAADQEYRKRNEQRPSLSGDFFPYGDVYVSGKPAYWTGFYGTRPYWKRFHREVENELRSAEILFTYANAIAKQTNSIVAMKILSYKYKELVTSRHDFGIFAHHDGITGTSQMWTMEDYGQRLHTALQTCVDLQIQSLKIIHKNARKTSLPAMSKDFIRGVFDVLPTKIPLEVFGKGDEYVTNIVIFNNLAWKRKELIKVLVKRITAQVVDSQGVQVPSQINPVFIRGDSTFTVQISDRAFELVFLADLEPLSLSTYQILDSGVVKGGEDEKKQLSSTLANVFCQLCFNLNETQFGVDDSSMSQNASNAMTLENHRSRLYFTETGLLDKVEMKDRNKSVPVSITYGFYRPVNKDSGAYLLKPILSTELMFFSNDNFSQNGVIKITGPIMSQVIAMHSSVFETIIVNTTLINVGEEAPLMHRILLENYVDLTGDNSKRLEVFMRLDTNLKSATGTETQDNTTSARDSPVMYTDQNGLVSERRVSIPEINYEGNTYPVTTMAHIQDEKPDRNGSQLRFSVLVDRTHGFTSVEEGRMETLIDRRSLYDDGRGLSEGVSDNKPTVSSYHLLLESLNGDIKNSGEGAKGNLFPSWQPTLPAQRSSLRLNYPPQVYVYNDGNNADKNRNRPKNGLISLVSSALPDNIHLLNLRTLSEEFPRNFDANSSNILVEKAGMKALLNLQFLHGYKPAGYRNCKKDHADSDSSSKSPEADQVTPSMFTVRHVKVSKVEETSLTGVDQRLASDGKGIVNGSISKKETFIFKSYNLFFR